MATGEDVRRHQCDAPDPASAGTAFRRLGAWEAGFTNRLAEVEIARAIDRLRLEGAYDDEDVAAAAVEAGALPSGLAIVDINEHLLSPAARPMLTVVGTLDAIHVVTALELRSADPAPLLFVTHDRRQRLCAQGPGMAVAG